MAGACVMRTAAFREAGGYWPAFFIGGEETLLALDMMELGWRIAYSPLVVTRHFPSRSRDEPLRRRMLSRNAIWTAWMRLPWRDAWRVTIAEFAVAHRSGGAARLLRDALAGAPRAIFRRKPVSPRVWRLWRTTNLQ
jgi:GT2 family glycosyltransferase